MVHDEEGGAKFGERNGQPRAEEKAPQALKSSPDALAAERSEVLSDAGSLEVAETSERLPRDETGVSSALGRLPQRCSVKLQHCRKIEQKKADDSPAQTTPVARPNETGRNGISQPGPAAL